MLGMRGQLGRAPKKVDNSKCRRSTEGGEVGGGVVRKASWGCAVGALRASGQARSNSTSLGFPSYVMGTEEGCPHLMEQQGPQCPPVRGGCVRALREEGKRGGEGPRPLWAVWARSRSSLGDGARPALPRWLHFRVYSCPCPIPPDPHSPTIRHLLLCERCHSPGGQQTCPRLHNRTPGLGAGPMDECVEAPVEPVPGAASSNQESPAGWQAWAQGEGRAVLTHSLPLPTGCSWGPTQTPKKHAQICRCVSAPSSVFVHASNPQPQPQPRYPAVTWHQPYWGACFRGSALCGPCLLSCSIKMKTPP